MGCGTISVPRVESIPVYNSGRPQSSDNPQRRDDFEFDQLLEILFKGVPHLRRIGCPGTLLPMKQNTRAIICGADSNNVIAAASYMGHGRCLVFAHDAYGKMFIESQSEDKRFVENCRQWLSKNPDARFISIDDANSFNEIDTDGSILVWHDQSTKTKIFMQHLSDYLSNGGGLICSSTPWGWLQLNPDKTLMDLSVFHFCNDIGIRLLDNYSNCPNPIPLRNELVKFKNIDNVTRRLARNPSDAEYIGILGSAFQHTGGNFSDLNVELLRDIVRKLSHDFIPYSNRPIKNPYRERVAGLSGVMCSLSGIKAPGVSNFPYDFEQKPQMDNNVTCHIESVSGGWYCTGYYVAPGVPIQIDTVKQSDTSNWYIRIGCHSDSIAHCDEYRRWPYISYRTPLINSSMQLGSAFGGLLFLESADEYHHSITLRLHNVVVTPMYDLNNSDRHTSWEKKYRHSHGLWADIAAEHVIFNLPSKSIRHMNSEQLDGVLRFWDSVVLAHHRIRNTKPEHRERIVCDEQISGGYMHSGYPIMTHLDVCDQNGSNFIFNRTQLQNQGDWGIFHELGHNVQRDWWTYEGTEEVTVNIFTLHAMNTVCHLPIWLHPWHQQQIDNTIQYIKRGCHYDEWKEDPGIGFAIYAQLAREFGWDSYKKVFMKYENTKPNLSTDQEKIDYWITTFSNVVNHNLVPLFKFWGIPVSQSTVDALQNFEIPKISDIFIDLSPDRYHI